MTLAASPFELGQMIKVLSVRRSQPAPESLALEAARAKQGNDRRKLEAYVAAHSEGAQMGAALAQGKRRLSLTLLAVLGLGALCGVSAVVSALVTGEDAALNIFWLIAALIGPATLALLIWAVMVWRLPTNETNGPLGRLVGAISKRFGGKDAFAGAATDVLLQQQSVGVLGRWRLSAMSHSFWLIYLLAACAVFVLMMAFQRYVFVWETTLLTPQQATALFDLLRAPIAALGLPTPSTSDIRAAQYTGGPMPTEQVSQVWAQFTLALLALYGVLPRVLLLAFSRYRASVLMRRQQLSSKDPFFAGIAAKIYQPDVITRVVDGEGRPGEAQPTTPGALESDSPAPHAHIVGWEIEDSALEAVGKQSALGVFDREEGLLQALARCDGPVAVAVSLLNTPGRGTARILGNALGSLNETVSFILLDRETLRTRLPQEDQDRRLADWWALLMKLGVAPSNITVFKASSARPVDDRS